MCSLIKNLLHGVLQSTSGYWGTASLLKQRKGAPIGECLWAVNPPSRNKMNKNLSAEQDSKTEADLREQEDKGCQDHLSFHCSSWIFAGQHAFHFCCQLINRCKFVSLKLCSPTRQTRGHGLGDLRGFFLMILSPASPWRPPCRHQPGLVAETLTKAR